LIHRAHAKENILIKNGKDYILNRNRLANNFTVIDQVKSQILAFKKELDKSISLSDINSESEFKEVKQLLDKLEVLSR
jgi:hypothetical protein